MSRLRSLAGRLQRTPLHPQWLLGRKATPEGVRSVRGRLLDVGAGDRWLERELDAGTTYVALDYPSTGRDMYGATPHVFANAAALPFADGSFDAVVCLEVIEHVPDPDKVIAEIARVLQPGGKAWLSMPFLYPLHDAPFDFQRFTEYGFHRSLGRAGLRINALRKNVHAVRCAGLLLCLAVAGGLQQGGRLGQLLRLPAAALMVLAINVSAYLLSLVWSDWENMASGYEVEVVKP